MPLQEWPEIDQRAWHVGRADGDVFDGSEASFRWKPQTFKVVATHYGRWLTYLKGSGLLDPTMGPAARINGQSLKGYVERLDVVTRQIAHKPWPSAASALALT